MHYRNPDCANKAFFWKVLSFVHASGEMTRVSFWSSCARFYSLSHGSISSLNLVIRHGLILVELELSPQHGHSGISTDCTRYCIRSPNSGMLGLQVSQHCTDYCSTIWLWTLHQLISDLWWSRSPCARTVSQGPAVKFQVDLWAFPLPIFLFCTTWPQNDSTSESQNSSLQIFSSVRMSLCLAPPTCLAAEKGSWTESQGFHEDQLRYLHSLQDHGAAFWSMLKKSSLIYFIAFSMRTNLVSAVASRLDTEVFLG